MASSLLRFGNISVSAWGRVRYALEPLRQKQIFVGESNGQSAARHASEDCRPAADPTVVSYCQRLKAFNVDCFVHDPNQIDISQLIEKSNVQCTMT